MARNWTIGQQLGAAFAVPVLVLALLGAVSYRNTQDLLETNRMVEHTYEVIQGIEAMLLHLRDSEAANRGYVLTGRIEFLDHYRRARDEASRRFEDIRKLTADNAGQQRRLDTMRGLLETKIAFMARLVDLRRTGGMEEAARFLLEDPGNKSMDAIRDLVEEMARAEHDLLQQRSRSSEAATARVVSGVVGGVAGTSVVMILVGILIVRGLGRQIGTAIQHIQRSSTELEAAATQQVRGSKEQSVASTEVSTTIRELVATSRQIAESAQRVTRIASDTAQAAQEGERVVDGAHEAMDAVRREVDRLVIQVLDLGRKSHQIGGILAVINELTEQTNILAINATIEAAGAGEAGRRFAVVADEIRRLADRVGSSTKDIRALIDEMRSAASAAVMATEDGAKAVGKSTRQFADVTTSFKSIADLVGSTVQAAREIELSTKQQTSAVEQVSSAISDVALTARETETSSSQMLRTTSELAALSLQLTDLIRRTARA